MLRNHRVTLIEYTVIAIATIILYLRQLYLYPVINPDGVTYLQAAAIYTKNGLHGILALGEQAKWPFYPIIIGWIHQILGLNTWTTQRWFDGFCLTASAICFLAVARLLSQHPRQGIWAIFLWISWHAYIKWWPQVIRDHGFLLCLLLSLYSYYYYFLKRNTVWAFAWSGSIFLGALFRIEGIIYALLLPFFSIFFLRHQTFRERLGVWIQLNYLSVILTLIFVALFMANKLGINSFRFAYIWQELSLYGSTVTSEFMRRYHTMAQYIFYRESPCPSCALVTGYFTLFIIYVINQINLAIIPVFLMMRTSLSYSKSFILSPIFIPYLSIALALPLLFFIEYAFLNGRYLLPFGLFTLLSAAIFLPHIIDKLTTKNRIMFIGTIGTLFTYGLIASMFSFGHKTYDDMEIGLWLKSHYPNQRILTTNKRILFYASNPPTYRQGESYTPLDNNLSLSILKQNPSWCNNDLLVLSFPPDKLDMTHHFFDALYDLGIIGTAIQHFKQISKNEDIVISPISREKCMSFIQKSTENS